MQTERNPIFMNRPGDRRSLIHTFFTNEFLRLYNTSTGAINHPAAMQALPINRAMIPVIGSALVDPTANYAL
jgi:hypothetical protein